MGLPDCTNQQTPASVEQGVYTCGPLHTAVHGRLLCGRPHSTGGPLSAHQTCSQLAERTTVARAAQATSQLVRRALEHVRSAHPHFNASNGADHAMVFSYDHARCDLAPGLALSEWGQLLSIQSYGDLTYTCAPCVCPLAHMQVRQDIHACVHPHMSSPTSDHRERPGSNREGRLHRSRRK